MLDKWMAFSLNFDIKCFCFVPLSELQSFANDVNKMGKRPFDISKAWPISFLIRMHSSVVCTQNMRKLNGKKINMTLCDGKSKYLFGTEYGKSLPQMFHLSHCMQLPKHTEVDLHWKYIRSRLNVHAISLLAEH